jgi:hypothetical protein
MRARQVTTSVRIEAPQEGRPSARINWLLRQLRDAPPELRVEVGFPNARETRSLLLREALEFPQRLLFAADPRRPSRWFVIALTRPMGLKCGKGLRWFVRETRREVLDFYGEVVQHMKPAQRRAPQLPTQPEDVPRTAEPDPPPFAAVDERDLGEGVDPRDDAPNGAAHAQPEAAKPSPMLALPRGD